MSDIDPVKDSLAATSDFGFSTAWQWKQDYMTRLKTDNGETDGYERISQLSATPDTTAIYAGPARFTAIDTNGSSLMPIGLIDGLNFSSAPMLQRLYEIGSNRAFFTRGKTLSQMSFSKLFANQENILAALAKNAYRPSSMPLDGAKAPGAASPNPHIMMNLDSEYFAVPFGIMLVFKTRGYGLDGMGSVLSAVYCEYCMFSQYNFGVSNGSPVIMENISLEFDRAVPIEFS